MSSATPNVRRSTGADAYAATAVAGDRALYLYSWDRLRILAAFDIVALHLTGTHALFGFGLPLFLILLTALGVSKPAPPPTARFARRRFARIVVPWAFWALFLAGLRIYFTWGAGEPPLSWFEWPMLLFGPRIHLWFLPFVAVAGIGAHLVHRATRTVPPLVAAGWALALGLALLFVPPRVTLTWPFDQWLFSLPAICFGFALGRVLSASGEVGRARQLVTAGYGLFALGAAAIVLTAPDLTGYVTRYAGGLGLLAFALWLPNTSDRFTRHLAPLMLGVYVLHPAIWGIFLRPLHNSLGVGGEHWLRVAVTFPVTLLTVYLLRLTRLKRVL